MRHWLAMGSFVLGSMALACGGGDTSGDVGAGQQAVTGTIARNLDNARAIAVTPTGKTYWSYVDKSGKFSLTIPAGTAFRLIVTNGLPTGGQKVIGRLAIHTSTGATNWMISPSGTLALGTLRPSGASTTSGTKTLSETERASSGSGDHEGSVSRSDDDREDGDCHEDEHEDEGVCSVASPEREDDDDVELEADHDPGDRCKDDKEKEHEDDEDADEHEGKGDHKACGGGGTSTPPAPTNVGVNGACSASANCAAGLACIASKCSVK